MCMSPFAVFSQIEKTVQCRLCAVFGLSVTKHWAPTFDRKCPVNESKWKLVFTHVFINWKSRSIPFMSFEALRRMLTWNISQVRFCALLFRIRVMTHEVLPSWSSCIRQAVSRYQLAILPCDSWPVDRSYHLPVILLMYFTTLWRRQLWIFFRWKRQSAR